ncbi:TPA: DotU family type IV/VI secretion system protein [Klebsiella oxytoca]|uniref:DotU family type IV/VI secretion system protein n=1 Tax=Klebsiella oxytoca TaxID=571 RepID=A0AAN5REN4_KLEOX|nr:DotU family type IV/VI secretion system protein [Klebsiella oxytoca]
MTTETGKNGQLDDLLYENASQMNMDSDYWFRMRGQSINPMIDAVTPLLGMVSRIRQLNQYDNVPDLYQSVVTGIQSVEQELHRHGYENGVILSFRYILCTFIDEAVMSKEWGSQSVWSENSLLARFHNETWGGEKVFVLLDKLQEEPQRYRDILEFIWLCLVLGFQGRYRVIPQGQGEYGAVIRRLHGVLYPEAVNAPAVLHLDSGQPSSRYRLRRQITLRAVFFSLCVLLVVVFSVYRSLLDSQTRDVLRQLSELLK